MDDTSVLDHYLAPLRPFLEPDDVTEVVINRPGEVGVEAAGQWGWHEVPELSEAWLRTLAMRSTQAVLSIVAEVQTRLSALTRSGASSASCMAIMPPSDTPATAALSMPAASMTASTSCASMARL